MFWVVDNFLMRKHRKLITSNAEQYNPAVHYVNKKQYLGGGSEDESALHLMTNESKDTLIDDQRPNDYLHRRNESVTSS